MRLNQLFKMVCGVGRREHGKALRRIRAQCHFTSSQDEVAAAAVGGKEAEKKKGSSDEELLT